LKSRHLITTADECTWPTDQPLLFLGEWCRLYNRRAVWEKLDAEIVPYHWDDRGKLHRDYLVLQDLYEELLRELGVKLNEIHGVDHSLRYWRVLIGPWLGYFTQMLFDRWEMVQRAVTDYSIFGVWILDTAQEQLIPNDMDHFTSLFLEDAWNEAIFGQLLRGWSTVPVKEVQSTAQSSPLPGVRAALTTVQRLKRMLAYSASVLSRMFVRDDEAFLMNSYLPIIKDLRLQWRMGQVPKLWRPFPAPKSKVDCTQRQWLMGQSSGLNSFPAIVRAMIPKHIPVLYLEGYAALQTACDNLPWPKRPRLIFTSNSYSSDDVFKAWAAEKVEEGVPLVIGQHGGYYGIGRWGFMEDHQGVISDCWLTWGWDDEKRPQIKPVGNLKMVGNNIVWDPEGNALMVETTIPRYSYGLYCVPVAGQWLDYFNDQCRFVDALPDEIRRCLLVRLYQSDYRWGQAARWEDRFPDVLLDDGEVPIAPLIAKSRLYVSTYNATTFLESLALNIPTIIFWNPNHWELRESVVPYFERLKEVGIFHKSPESAAHQMARVWDDVATWWYSDSVQAARKEFCYRYSRMPEQPLKEMEHVLRRVAKAAIE
jgi:putative transferase (TIGR04331 family)